LLAGGVPVSVTVGGGGCGGVSARELMTMSTAMMMASAPSTPAAHSSARWPEENVRRGGGGRRLVVDGRARPGAAFRAPATAAALVAGLDGMAAGAARPGGGDWLGRGGRRPARTAATASANGPPLRYRIPGFLTSVISMSSRTLGGSSGGNGGGGSLMCFIATVRAPSPVNGRLPETTS
jgi:hypothetical protein